jgi:hypothetical protein
MSESNSKYVKVGQIVLNTDKEGKEYQQLILNKEFIENANNLIKLAFLDKSGGRRFNIFEPFEGAPSFVKYNVCVKKAE